MLIGSGNKPFSSKMVAFIQQMESLYSQLDHECKGVCAPIHIFFFITMAMYNSAHLGINVLFKYTAKQLYLMKYWKKKQYKDINFLKH